MYGLRLSHLLLPVEYHRLPLNAPLQGTVQLWGPWPMQEGCQHAALGTLALGFVVVIISFLFGRRGSDAPRLVSGLGMLAVSGFFLGTVGGVGALFANYVSPQIRGYNRVSIYLGFFALFGVALILTKLLDKAGRWGQLGRLVGSAFCLLLLVGGIWDQTTPALVLPYAASKTACQSEQTFVGQIEQRFPPGHMVFQMPLGGFPEGPE